MKRVSDIILSLLLLIILLPILVLIAILIGLSSRGPILYKQDRVGLEGKHFVMYKFRTMVNNAEKTTGPVFAKGNDPRVTGIGKSLRHFNLDELPQLINVLEGDMSLIGPRPERLFFHRKFLRIKNWKKRLGVLPGISGLAQINGVGSDKPSRKLNYDLEYMKKRSLGLDMYIIRGTIGLWLAKLFN